MVGEVKNVELQYSFDLSCYQLKIDSYIYILYKLHGSCKVKPVIDTQKIKKMEPKHKNYRKSSNHEEKEQEKKGRNELQNYKRKKLQPENN